MGRVVLPCTEVLALLLHVLDKQCSTDSDLPMECNLSMHSSVQ